MARDEVAVDVATGDAAQGASLAVSDAGCTDRAQQLMEQYTEIAGLAGALAHEIKNPLSTMSLNLELLAEDLEGQPSPHDRRALSKIRVIQRECQHLQEILDDFLRFARVNELTLRREDLNERVQEVIDFYGPQADQHHVDILPYLAADLPPVALDRHLFQRVLLNLVLNAQQAMPEGGQLTFRTYEDGEHVRLDLIDTGCGMDAETLKAAFRVFFSTKRDGNGLGLPTARKIIQAHRGQLAVESELGKGTRFTISLPVARPDSGDEA